MNIGYIRVSKADGEQAFNQQHDALVSAGVDSRRIFVDRTNGRQDDRSGLANCLKALREDDTLVVWTIGRLGRNLKDLLNCVRQLEEGNIDLCVLNGFGRELCTSTTEGKVLFQTIGALFQFERERVSEQTKAGLREAAKRGRKGGRKYALTPEKIRSAQVALNDKDADIEAICHGLGVTRTTLYRYMDSSGNLRKSGKKVLKLAREKKV